MCGQEKRKVRRGGRTFLFAKTADPTTDWIIADQRNKPEAYFRFFFLATFFFATFFLVFFAGFFLAAFFFAMVLFTSFRLYEFVKKNLAFQTIILFYRQSSQDGLRHFMGRCAESRL